MPSLCRKGRVLRHFPKQFQRLLETTWAAVFCHKHKVPLSARSKVNAVKVEIRAFYTCRLSDSVKGIRAVMHTTIAYRQSMQGMACGIVPSALRLARLKLSSTKSFYYTEEFCRETAACVAVQHKDNPLERKVHCRERSVHTHRRKNTAGIPAVVQCHQQQRLSNVPTD